MEQKITEHGADHAAGETDRGQPATIDRKTGEVHGSGAGAGGGNDGEDYFRDPMGGSGDEPQGAARPIEDAEPGPDDRHQGHYG